MFTNIKAGIFITLAVLFITFTFYGWQLAKTPNLQADKPESFVLLIPEGSTYESVLDTLKKNDVINDQMSFRFMAKLLNYPERVKAGRYVIKSNSGNLQVISKLRNGLQDAVKLTFNNIRLKDDLIERVGRKFAFGPAILGEMLNDPAVCQKYGLDTTNIVSMFLPNTYELFWNTKPEKLLDRMHDEYKKFWTAARLEKAKAIGLTPAQVSVMASIVDAETNQEDEMPRVAGVYLNRYNLPMPLQADPTVIFAWRDFGIKRVTERLLAIRSPYNTYRNQGLPPGPINLPSTVAIDAVLNAEKHDYLYFCVKLGDDGKFTGHHEFAATYEDHQNNARLYQKRLNELKIQK